MAATTRTVSKRALRILLECFLVITENSGKLIVTICHGERLEIGQTFCPTITCDAVKLTR